MIAATEKLSYYSSRETAQILNPLPDLSDKQLMRSFLAVAGLLVVVNVLGFSGHTVRYAPGVLVPDAPRQSAAEPKSFKFKNVQITPLAKYSITGRVIARNSYWLGKEADVSPIDIGLAWGLMSDQSAIDKMHFNLSLRYLRWTADELPLARESVESQISNNHLIAANPSIAGQLERISVGQLVHLEGKLVRVEDHDGWTWSSSLSRTDEGPDSCELMYVEKVEQVSKQNADDA